MRGQIHFVAPELVKWDGVEADGLVLTFFHDERPLRGAAGLADWRLCGRLSGLLRRGKLKGERGELMMMPPSRRRLGFGRILLLGLGDSSLFAEEGYRAHVKRIREVAAKAGLGRYAVQPPGRATGLIAARRALELWLEETDADPVDAEVTIIESAAGQKEMIKSLRATWKQSLGEEGKQI